VITVVKDTDPFKGEYLPLPVGGADELCRASEQNLYKSTFAFTLRIL
jgi:hypothetical protein